MSERAKIYDFAASMLFIIESGGTVTDWEGKAFTSASRNIVTSNGEIHSDVVEALKG